MKAIIIMLCIAFGYLIVISTYHHIKMNRCLKKHQQEWNERRRVAIDMMPNITQDELMVLYLEYCKEIQYSYTPYFNGGNQ